MGNSSIGVFEKIVIRHNVYKDIRGVYGKELTSFVNNQGGATIATFPISGFSELLTKKYKYMCAQIISKYEKKHIRSEYVEICKKYQAITELEKSIRKKTDEIDRQISELSYELEKNKEDRSRASYYDKIPQSTGAANLGELGTRISELEQRISILQGDKRLIYEEKQDDGQNIQKQIMGKREQLNNRRHEFLGRIDFLYNLLKLLEAKFDLAFSYYWHLVCRKKNIVMGTKSFAEICLLCNSRTIEKKDLFPDECSFVKNI